MTRKRPPLAGFIGRLEARPTFHESCLGLAVVVEVHAVDVPQAVVPQLRSVTQTLQDGVHEALQQHKHERRLDAGLIGVESEHDERGVETYGVAQVLQTHQTLRTLVL